MGSLVSTSNLAVSSDGDTHVAVKSDNEWFSRIIKTAYPTKPATALHFLSGCEERAAFRYVRGEVAVPGWLVRNLLRSEHGGLWQAAIMDGASPTWWRDHVAAEKFYWHNRTAGFLE